MEIDKYTAPVDIWNCNNIFWGQKNPKFDFKWKFIWIMLWIKNYLVNLVCLGHNNTVPLNNHCVCVHPALKIDDDDVKYFGNLDFDDFVSPLILSLMISTLIHIILTLIILILSHRWFWLWLFCLWFWWL